MADYDGSLPIRTEADGDDERVQTKIVDASNPDTQQMEVDTDNNAHVELHGNKPDTTDVVMVLSEEGRPNPNGDYDVSTNTKPGSVGIIAHDRNASPGEITQNLRPTAVVGESDSTNLDVALHDESGNNYDADNPLPVTFEESEGDEIHDSNTGDTIVKDATEIHTLSIADGKTFLLHQILSSGSGKIKTLVEIGDGGVSEVFVDLGTKFNSTANTNADFDLKVPVKLVGTVNTTSIRVTITNRDNQSQDLYSTIIGVQRDT